MKLRFLSVLTLCALAMGTAGFANTPDGETPADETVCDELTGRAAGLCNAYCEAMDCDGDPRASAKACDQVRSKLDAILGPGNIPCEQSEACPCAELYTQAIDTGVFDNGCVFFESQFNVIVASCDALFACPGQISLRQGGFAFQCSATVQEAGILDNSPVSLQQEPACRAILQQAISDYGCTNFWP